MLERGERFAGGISREERDRALLALTEEYPKTFFIEPKRRVPLKHGIEEDIKADLITNQNSALRYFDIDDVVGWYRSHVGYLNSCSVAGVGRLDLKGMVVAKVTEAEARIAGEKATEIFADIERRKRQWQRPQQSGFSVARATPPVRVRSFAVDTKLSNLDMLTAVQKQLELVKTILGDIPDDSLRRELARPALRLVVDELNTIIARFD
jgi:sRNA-binding protein